jgi:hypothetical protein
MNPKSWTSKDEVEDKHLDDIFWNRINGKNRLTIQSLTNIEEENRPLIINKTDENTNFNYSNKYDASEVNLDNLDEILNKKYKEFIEFRNKSIWFSDERGNVIPHETVNLPKENILSKYGIKDSTLFSKPASYKPSISKLFVNWIKKIIFKKDADPNKSIWLD